MESLSSNPFVVLSVRSGGFELPRNSINPPSNSHKTSLKADGYESDIDTDPSSPETFFHWSDKIDDSNLISLKSPHLLPPKICHLLQKSPRKSILKQRSSPKRKKYIHTPPGESCLPKCYCNSCCEENTAAVLCLAVVPRKGPSRPSYKIKACDHKQIAKKIRFDGVQRLVYDVHSGDVFHSKEENVDLSGIKKDIGRLKGLKK